MSSINHLKPSNLLEAHYWETKTRVLVARGIYISAVSPMPPIPYAPDLRVWVGALDVACFSAEDLWT